MRPSEPHGRPRFALDGSALLAMMDHTPGGSVVGAKLHHSAISTLNLAAVLDISRAQGMEVGDMIQNLQSLGLSIEPFLPEDAFFVSQIAEASHRQGLSIIDRACLALAHRLDIPVLTTHLAWNDLPFDIEVQVLR